jgi:hypothetical protein
MVIIMEQLPHWVHFVQHLQTLQQLRVIAMMQMHLSIPVRRKFVTPMM